MNLKRTLRLLIKGSALGVPEKNIIFLDNKKAGCTTIKVNLLARKLQVTADKIIEPHKLEHWATGFEDLDFARSANIIAFARNPYSRLVSTYKNTILGKNKGLTKKLFEKAKLKPTVKPKFEKFVEIICETTSPLEMNGQWRPQWISHLTPVVIPNFLGFLETMNQDLATLFATYMPGDKRPILRANSDSTNAEEVYRDYYTDTITLDLVRELYDKDFEHYGYDHEIDAPTASSKRSIPVDHVHESLAHLIFSFRSDNDKDALKEFAPEKLFGKDAVAKMRL